MKKKEILRISIDGREQIINVIKKLKLENVSKIEINPGEIIVYKFFEGSKEFIE